MYESLYSLKVQELRLSVFVLDYERIGQWKKKKEIMEKQLDEVLVIKTNTCSTSIRLHRLPPTFILSLQLKTLIKAD